MNPTDIFNYVVFNNPISKTLLKPFLNHSTTSLPSAPVTIIQEVPLWQLSLQTGPFVKLAGLSGAAAVILGAYGSHKSYPKDRVKELKTSYEVANKYHFLHTLALFTVPLAKYPKVTGPLFITGTLLFSGPCYYHAFTGEDKVSRLAPIGGTILIVAWLSLII